MKTSRIFPAFAFLLTLFAGAAQAYTTTYTSGSGNWTAPAGVTSVLVETWGGGGAGGGRTATGTGGGGGGGGYSASVLTVVPGNSYAYAVGAGGTTSTGNGGPGGSSTFNTSSVIALGGAGGGGGTSTSTAALGAAAGTGTTTHTGGNGTAETNSCTTPTGAGGGGAGSTANGSAGSGVTGGAGGATGGGTGGAGKNSNTNANGSAGNPNGGGGGGACRRSISGVNGTGGAGAAGEVAITYPTVTTVAATSITATGATLNSTVVSNDLVNTTAVTFNYGLTTSYGSSVTATGSPFAISYSGSPAATLTGLTCNTTYHYQVQALNRGTAVGLDASFTTSACTSQTISFTSTAPVNATVGGATYTPTATATSGLTPTITVDASSSSVCSISAGVVSFHAAGTCLLDANQAGNGTYSAAPQVQQSFAVKANQTVSFTSTAPGATVGGATYTPTATATSSLTVAITVDASSSSICSISAGVVSFNAAGNCLLDANQAGNTNYNAATQVQQSVTVGKGSQTVSFTSTAPSATVGGATYTPTATATSSLTVAITVDASSSSICSISAGVVSFNAAGNCLLDANQAGNTNYNAATQVQQSVTVGKGSETVSFTSTAPSATVGGATYTPTATATSGLTVAITVDASSSSICSISAGVVSFHAAGNCLLDANQAGNTNYNAATQVQQSVTVGKGSQTVSFTSTAPGATVSGATYTPTATATSGLTVAITVDASSSSICSISAGVVSFHAAGTCLLDANQAGNTNYNAATQVQQSVTVGKGSQTVSFTSTAPGATVSGATYTPTATATSGLTVAITVDASSSSICSISAGVVSFNAAGTCLLDANQAGNTNYNAATQVQQNVTVSKASQTISFGSAPSVVVDGTGTMNATATSGYTITFTSQTPDVCTVSGYTVTGVSVGTCTIAADQAGDATYSAAPEVTQSFSIGKGDQTIVFDPAPNVDVNGTGTVSATASSGLAVTFTSQTTSICTVSGSTVTGVNAGTCIIAADQGGDANYNPATQVTQSFSIGMDSQTISFGSAPSGVVVDGSGTVNATATSELAVSFTSLTPDVCTVSDNIVTGVSVGTCTIAADQGGDANYNPAPEVTQDFSIGMGNQTISFGGAPNVVVTGTGTVSATATSGLAVSFTSQTPSICTVSGSTVTGVNAGTCTIAADQGGDANYYAATQVTQSFSVGMDNQTISFGSAPNVVVDGTGALNATATSGLAVSFSSLTETVCTVSGSTVTGVSVGTCTVAADQAGDANYNAATEVTQNFSIGLGSQTISFDAAPSVVVGGTGTVSASGGNSGNPVTFTSTTTDVCTVSGSTVTGVSAGTCIIAADQAGSANYNAATEVTQSFSVGLTSQTISFGSAPSVVVGGTGTVSATATSGLPVSFASTTTGVCTVSSSTVTGVSAGTCTITADQSGDDTYSRRPAGDAELQHWCGQSDDYLWRRTDSGCGRHGFGQRYRRCIGQSGFLRQHHCECLHGQRQHRDRCQRGHLHHCRQSGGERQLQCCRPGDTEHHCRSGQSDHQLRGSAHRSRGRHGDGQRHRWCIGQPGHLHQRHYQCLHDQRHEWQHRDRPDHRHLYHQCRSGGERQLQRRDAGAAELRHRCGQPDHQLRGSALSSRGRHRHGFGLGNLRIGRDL